MKKLLTAAFIAGAVGATIILLLNRRTPEEKAADDVTDAAEDAFNTMDKHVKKVENATERALKINLN